MIIFYGFQVWCSSFVWFDGIKTMFVGQEEIIQTNYSNRVEKEKAWEEIFKYLDNEYEIKTAVEEKNR